VTTAVSELLSGVGLLGRALGLITRRPRLFLLGMIPPLITSTLFVIALIVLFAQLDGIVGALTPFADGWSAGAARLIRILIGVGLVAGSGLVMVVSFTALTLTLGSPLYDKISEAVEQELGTPGPAYEEPLSRAAVRALRQSLGLILVSAVVALGLFFVGFIPVLGQTAVPVISAAFGGWMLSIELVGSTFDRRGMLRISDRRAAMRHRRAHVLGLGIPTFLLLSIPFAGAVVFPVATAAGTLLARDLLASHPAPTGRPAAV
jgi:CysZ protein